jgi:hypothetical protein
MLRMEEPAMDTLALARQALLLLSPVVTQGALATLGEVTEHRRHLHHQRVSTGALPLRLGIAESPINSSQ